LPRPRFSDEDAMLPRTRPRTALIDGLPREPGRPGTLWLDDRERVRRVLAEITRQPPLAPATAARAFLAWLQDMGLDGEHRWGGDGGLWELYLWHCHDTRNHAIPSNLLAAALAPLVDRWETADYSTGTRRRLTVYLIPPGDHEIEARAAARRPRGDAVPAEPLRRAA
jgi:hypothetical protein